MNEPGRALEGLVRKTLAAVLSIALACMLVPFTAFVPQARGAEAQRSTQGTAYAVLTGDGELVFLRSDTYTSGATITDILGNEYTGTIYLGIETRNQSNNSNAVWRSKATSIKSVRVADGQAIRPKNTTYWFSGCTKLVEFSQDGFDTSSVTNMSYMFRQCTSLKQLDISGFKTPAVWNMLGMFYYSSALRSLDISGLSTARVTSMRDFFQNCSSLERVRLGTGFSFVDNARLPASPSGNWMTESGDKEYTATELSSSYDGATMAGTYIAAPRRYAVLQDDGELVFFRSFETHSPGAGETATDTTGTQWEGLLYANISVSPGSKSAPWYADREKIVSVRVASGQTMSFASFSYLFEDCPNLVEADLDGLVASSPTASTCRMFYGCAKLRHVGLSFLDGVQPFTAEAMFSNCTSLAELDLSDLDTTKTSDMSGFFSGCTGLVKVVLGRNFSFKGSKAAAQTQLPTPPSSGLWATPDSRGTRYDPGKLAAAYDGATMSGTYVWAVGTYAVLQDDGELVLFQSEHAYSAGASRTVEDVDGATYTGRLYTGVQNTGDASNRNALHNVPWDGQRASIRSVRVASGQHVEAANLSYLFANCANLTSVELEGLETSEAVYMDGMFSGCAALRELDLGCLDTSSVTDMSYLFHGCTSLRSVGLDGLQTAAVTSMVAMFGSCSSLASVDLSAFDTSSCSDMLSMFDGCTALQEVTLGRNFSPAGKGIPAGVNGGRRAVLPAPPTSSPYCGMWMRADRAFGPYAPAELAEAFDGSTMAGAYVWATGVVTVRFDANGGTFAGANSMDVTMLDGGPLREPDAEPTRKYHELAGWSTTPDGQEGTQGGEAPDGTGAVLFAQWDCTAQLTVTVPLEVALLPADDGTLVCADEALLIENRAEMPIHLNAVSASASPGIRLVERNDIDSQDRGIPIALTIKGEGDEIDLARCQEGPTPPHSPDAWDIAQAGPDGSAGLLHVSIEGATRPLDENGPSFMAAQVHWTFGAGRHRISHKHFADYTVEELSDVSRDLASEGCDSAYYYEFNGYLHARETWGALRSDGVTVNDESALSGIGDVDNRDRYLECAIAGINQDTRSDGAGTAGLTFISTNVIAQEHRMNASDTNFGGWKASELRAKLNPEGWTGAAGDAPPSEGMIWNMLSRALRESIVAVDKNTNNTGGYATVSAANSNRKSSLVSTTSDKVFIPAVAEIFGGRDGTADATLDYGRTQYALFALGGQANHNTFAEGMTLTRSGKTPSRFDGIGGMLHIAWLRDPVLSATSEFYGINPYGYHQDAGTATSAAGVLICFCL